MKNAVTITRRKLAAALISSPALAQVPALAQTPADPLQAARDRIKTTSDALAREQVPMDAEPAFQFKA
jgi:hypothetical protein